MKYRVIAFLMTLVILFGIAADLPVAAASNPKWKQIATTNLTDTDAKIGASATFSSSVKITKGGFYLGTSKDNMKKNAYPDIVSATQKVPGFIFTLSKYKETLRPGTTYYFKVYMVAGGKEYTSPVYSFKTTGDAATPTWNTAVTPDFKDATLKATANFTGKSKVTKAGVYFGTAKDSLSKLKTLTVSKAAAASYTASFKLSSLKKTLSPGKTYYYKYFVEVGGKTYYSPVYSFKAKSAEDYATTTISGITKTDASVAVKIANAKKQKITQVQIQVGTTKDKFETLKTYKPNSKATSLSYSLKLSGSGYKLKAGTEYFYRICMTIDGVKSYTTVRSFYTEANATKITFPLPTNKVWKSTTYEGHSKSNKSGYASIDMTTSGGSAGYAVYSLAEGVVYEDKYKVSNGQITIKYTTTLITTNGAKYTSWYATYAHMTNITVKKGDKVKAGQQIGKVGDVGISYGAHLHLTISSAHGGVSWYQNKKENKDISPYYIYGFVDGQGKETSYSKFTWNSDTKAAVHARLINNPPTGK